MNPVVIKLRFSALALLGLLILMTPTAFARDISYQGTEVDVFVSEGEPTQIQFPDTIAGGYIPSNSQLSIERKGSDLIMFPKKRLKAQGEGIIVRLKDGRSFSLRIKRSSNEVPRDALVRIEDLTPKEDLSEEEEDTSSLEAKYSPAPNSSVAGLMREMVLNAEFGKEKIRGYRINRQHRGETILNDGAMKATIDTIYVGSRFWGYVVDAENLLDTTQKINPGTFRLDGTRAISATDWELAPRPTTLEEKIADKHTTKLYIITRSK